MALGGANLGGFLSLAENRVTTKADIIGVQPRSRSRLISDYRNLLEVLRRIFLNASRCQAMGIVPTAKGNRASRFFSRPDFEQRLFHKERAVELTK